MNVREEDREKSCPSRGLGIAAAAIGVGVGVGAALYYFFSKRPEHPHSEGSTSHWNYEPSDTFIPLMDDADRSYFTTSEYETSDTSINESVSDNETHTSDNESHSSDNDSLSSDNESDNQSYSSDNQYNSSDVVQISDTETSTSSIEHNYYVAEGSNSEMETEWDVTSSSSGVREADNPSSFQSFVNRLFTPRRETRTREDDQAAEARRQAFRERTWTHEDCSICFEVMLRSQELMTLPCTHNFHAQCILPWLQEQQTCPNCRKMAE